MKNGWFHETGKYAPETAIGTGAKEPLVNEFEAAQATPSVDETTLGAGKKSKNVPRPNENSDIKPSGEKVADDASELVSNGQEKEVRDGTNQNVVANDTNVNKIASEARPEAPQNAKKTQKPPVPAKA